MFFGTIHFASSNNVGVVCIIATDMLIITDKVVLSDKRVLTGSTDVDISVLF